MRRHTRTISDMTAELHGTYLMYITATKIVFEREIGDTVFDNAIGRKSPFFLVGCLHGEIVTMVPIPEEDHKDEIQKIWYKEEI